MKFEDQSLHSPSKLEKLCELLVVAIIKHDLPFQFVEYEGIRALFSYKCEDIELVSTNTIKADVFSMYKRECETYDSVALHSWKENTHIRPLDIHSNERYVCLIAHFVGSNWIL